jgi:hypothetical protein
MPNTDCETSLSRCSRKIEAEKKNDPPNQSPQNKKPESKPKPRRLVKADPDKTHQSAAAANRSVYYYDVTPDGQPTYQKHTLTLSETVKSGSPNPKAICNPPCVEKDPAYINEGEMRDEQGVTTGRPFSVERRWSEDGQAAGVLNEKNQPFDFEILNLNNANNPPFQVGYGNDPKP